MADGERSSHPLAGRRPAQRCASAVPGPRSDQRREQILLTVGAGISRLPVVSR